MFFTPARNSAGSSRSSRSCKNVTWASTFETTLRAWNSVPSSSATPVAPHPAHAIALPHDGLEKHVGRARNGGRRHGADDRVGRKRDFQQLRLEPTVEDGQRRARQDLERSWAGTTRGWEGSGAAWAR